MKRFRVKLAGFGLAMLAGSAVADEWRPTARPPVRSAALTSPEPSAVEVIWLPSAGGKPTGVIPAQFPDLGPAQPVLPQQMPPAEPRPGALPPASLPMIPVAPEVNFLPPKLTIEPPPTPPTEQLPRPRRSDEVIPPDPPRPATSPPAVVELPVAPPELMVPVGMVVPGKHGGFGSPPVRLGRDYPPLADLCPSLLGSDLGAEPSFERGFVETEYLLWWMSGLDIPILATTNANPRRFGFLGEPGTFPILGPGTFLGSSRQGVRVRGGFWVNDCATCGIDGSIFVLGRQSADAVFAAEQFPIITRPVFSPNPRPNQPNVPVGQVGEAVAVPDVLQGALSVEATSFLWGADANLRKCLFRTCDASATWFVGYRNLNLTESLSIAENIAVIGPGANRVLIPDPVGTMIVVRDRFATKNYFHGGQIGATWERRWGRIGIDARTSIGFGNTHQELSISGTQTRTRPGQLPVTYSGGLLAAGSNLGTFTRDRFSVVPEFTLNLGYWVTPALKAYIGYNFLYWTNVIRPGEQVDPVVDLTFVPNAPPVAFSGQFRPQPLFRQSDLWVTGLQFGLEWSW